MVINADPKLVWRVADGIMIPSIDLEEAIPGAITTPSELASRSKNHRDHNRQERRFHITRKRISSPLTSGPPLDDRVEGPDNDLGHAYAKEEQNKPMSPRRQWQRWLSWLATYLSQGATVRSKSPVD